MAIAMRHDRTADNLPPGFAPRPDNFSTMLFIAALFHSVLILGVSFTAGVPNDSASDSTSVEVVLLTREYEKRPENNDAEYIARQNLIGAGNTTDTIYVWGDMEFLAGGGDDYDIYDLHLGDGSVCRDAGDGDAAPAQDIDGNDRYDVTTLGDTGTGTPTYTDLGAYEYWPSS